MFLKIIIWAVWNLILAFFPFFISLKIRKITKPWGKLNKKARFEFIALFIFWFFFFPNIPYIFSEVRHVTDYCRIFSENELSYCLKKSGSNILLFSYGSLAVLPFVFSLKNVSDSIGRVFKKWIGKVFPFLMIPITSIGIIIGLVGRFNSWDIFQPKKILDFLIANFSFIDFALTSFALYLIYFFTNFFLKNYEK